MRFLLDSHVLLWVLADPAKIPKATRALLASSENVVFFSAASIWEIAIKSKLGRGDFSVRPAEVARIAVDSGFAELPVDATSAAMVAELPPHHRDPFDRLLVAQAMVQPARFLTADRTLAKYSELVTII